MKSWGLNLGKCKPNSSLDKGDLTWMDGTWYGSSDCIKKADWRSTPLEWSSETLGGGSVQSGWDGIDEKLSTDDRSLGYKDEEEEEGLCLLLEEAPLMSLSGPSKGLTISGLEHDLVSLKGASFDWWNRLGYL